MVTIDKVDWGNVWIKGKKYYQVLILGEKVVERKSGKLRQLFGTTHRLGDWEQKQLLAAKPEVILIASGWDGLLKVEEGFKKKISEREIELKVVLSGQVTQEYNQLVNQGKKVNALIHTTC